MAGSRSKYWHREGADGDTVCGSIMISMVTRDDDRVNCPKCLSRMHSGQSNNRVMCRSCGKSIDPPNTAIEKRHIACHKKQVIIDRDFARFGIVNEI